MNAKSILIIAIVAVVAIVAGVIFSGALAPEEAKTPFDTNFMSGAFSGNAKLANDTDEWGVTYEDSGNDIEYNITTVKNASFIVEMYTLQGMSGPEHRTYNGQEWDIYTAQGVNEGNGTNTSVQVYMCVAGKDGQDYLVYVIFSDIQKVNASDNVFCPAFKDYVQPLLESIKLKHNADAPELSTILGVSQEDLDTQYHLMKEAKKGNQTAISILSGNG